MDLYDTVIKEIKTFQAEKAAAGELKPLVFSKSHFWPSAGDRNLVLQSDMAVELGNPANASVSLTLWTENNTLVADSGISLVGPDVAESDGRQLPFGKIVLIHGNGFNEDNAYDRYREMDSVRLDLSLSGYMMRAASQYMREWSRISRDAVENGFSLSVLGSALISDLKKINYIQSAEVFFITSADLEVSMLYPMAEKVDKINKAISKMADEMRLDCKDCDYEKVCSEVAGLRNMREKMRAGVG